ncbi:MAG: cytochrome c biogenesis protein CcdA [Lysobacter sp.]|nr:cytochrome c biogenesis protein CcdA [Lysobacter sp.]
MESSVFLGGSVVAAFVAGVIALLAPCCISVMLPAYFASSFQNRRLLVAMTTLFAAGVATVILPLALGASALRRLVAAEHTTIYLVGGALMLALGAYTLLGGTLKLPMPGRRSTGSTGPLGVYSLGVFSGVASSCCAPVLAGVLALSGAASSFGWALGLGTTYVVGMVAPLVIVSLLWDRRDWSQSRLFHPRFFTVRLGRGRHTITGTALASGALLSVMGIFAVWVGLAGRSMTSSGWQARVSLELQRIGRRVTDALDWLPGWTGWLLLIAVLALTTRTALRQLGWSGASSHPSPEEDDLVHDQTTPSASEHSSIP